jgi:N-ethylmaleimide reductase
MSNLFEPAKAGDLSLSNRIAMAPLTRNRSPGAVPGPHAVEYYTQRASAGLLITEATAISHQGQGYADVPGLYGDDQLAAWRKVTDAVHAAGGKIVTQLWHVGRVSHETLQPGGGKPVAPSAIAAKTKTYLVNPTAAGSICGHVGAARARAQRDRRHCRGFPPRSACRHRDRGFDGVEIHAANGYLVDQFLRVGLEQARRRLWRLDRRTARASCSKLSMR